MKSMHDLAVLTRELQVEKYQGMSGVSLALSYISFCI